MRNALLITTLALATALTGCGSSPGGDTAAAPAAPAPASAAPLSTVTKLEIQEVAPGTGALAEAGKKVKVHYTGKLTDGSKFDSSLDRGDPIEFTLGSGQVIKGWDQGIAGMKVGGKRKLTIPSDLAYGDAGRPPVIPPKATLVFDVELMAVQ